MILMIRHGWIFLPPNTISWECSTKQPPLPSALRTFAERMPPRICMPAFAICFLLENLSARAQISSKPYGCGRTLKKPSCFCEASVKRRSHETLE